jgi:peptidoglycan/xylan/chitin deacetylase (PgdA/CDA1 family)
MFDQYAVMQRAFLALERTRAHRWMAPLTQGSGLIFTLHRICPKQEKDFAPNRLLEITPEFLDQTLTATREAGFEIISLTQAVERLKKPIRGAKPFAVFTSDDGYKDNRDYAQPVFQKHQAPWTLFVTTGFADATSPLWWLDFEDIVTNLDRLEWTDDHGNHHSLSSLTPDEKQFAANTMYWSLREGSEAHLRQTMKSLCQLHGIDPLKRVREMCLSWDELRVLSQDPLVSFGAHSVTHNMLAKHPYGIVKKEMELSREKVSAELGRPIAHFAYPVGDPTSAGQREFELARDVGFEAALTTRPGHLFKKHIKHLHALPRVSLNGLFQTHTALKGMLSGVPFFLWNKGRRYNVN